MLYDYISEDTSDVGLTGELWKNKEEHRRMISASIRKCCSGSSGAKETVKELIYNFSYELFRNREEWLCFLPFDYPERMTQWQQMEALIFYFDKETADQGFRLLCERFEWNRNGFTVDTKEVRQAYKTVCPVFTPEEERSIVTQLLFAAVLGLGKIDTLNQQKGFIEEIQIGMGGKAEQKYNYTEMLSARQSGFLYRDGVHIMANGCTFHLKAISFDSEEELQRVLRNLIKDCDGGELTKNHPMLVADTPDGRRISVSRPPVTDTWVGLIRKFDTMKEVSLNRLLKGCPGEEVLPSLLRQLVRSGRNIAITGEMASGKTTLFRACLAETKKNLSIRVIEAESFELNVREFLPKANCMTMRVTEQTPSDEVLAFARKTTGQVFAVGEINSAAVAVMAMDLSKIASQLMFSAHYITTEHMIADFINAKLCVGGYADEALAEPDVIRCLGFDIHLHVKGGKRYVQYINEVVPTVRNESTGNRSYEIRPIYVYDEEKEVGVVMNPPGKDSYARAKQYLEKEEYMEFVRFFEN